MKEDARYQNHQDVQTAEKIKIVLSPIRLMQSILENAGDALHSLHFYKNINMAYAVYRSGKYLQRLIDSAADLFPSASIQLFSTKFKGDAEYFGFEDIFKVAETSVKAKGK